MKRFVKEPLLHFFLLGAGIFLAYSLLGRPEGGGESGEIIVSRGQVEQLAAGFTKAWRRPPTPQELDGMISDRVREEVYYREAIALGLDKDDPVIRRRLRQKMMFISEGVSAQVEPDEAELNAYLQAHPETFRVGPRYTFSQVYLDPKEHGDQLENAAARLLEQLNRDGSKVDPAILGDSLLLESNYGGLPAQDVVNQFGATFATQLAAVVPGSWQGPIESGYGVHLVRVSERTQGGLPALADVRDRVRSEWANARGLEANEDFYQALLRRYSVTIESLEPTAVEKLAAGARD